MLDRLQDVGLIDDAGFAVAMAQSQHRQHGLARRAVAARLRRHGLSDEVVGPALASIDPDSERAAAEAFVARRMRSVAALAPEVAARRLMAALARRGFSAELAGGVVRDAVPGVQDTG